MVKDYKALADCIVSLVGGKDNIQGLTHCMTRLHFKLKDESIADTAALEKTEGVLKVIISNGRYMVIIGLEVLKVYDEIVGNYPIQREELAPEKKPGFFSTLSDIFAGAFSR